MVADDKTPEGILPMIRHIDMSTIKGHINRKGPSVKREEATLNVLALSPVSNKSKSAMEGCFTGACMASPSFPFT